MPSDAHSTANPGYALGQLEAALQTAERSEDPGVRERAAVKADRWRAVLDGMASGALTVGSRTPVAGTPAWVTLEVAHGGFATGRYLAEQALDDAETARLAGLPAVPGRTDRERLNLWYLSDAGQDELLAAMTSERYAVDLPEHAALPAVALLLDRGHGEQALDLIASLRPLLHRLRFTPRLTDRPRPGGLLVHLEPVGAVATRLRETVTPAQVRAMQAALQVWHPLYDDLVALWAGTVEGELPRLVEQDGRTVVDGGWPCRRFPADWSRRRQELLDRYDLAVHRSDVSTRHSHRRSNLSRLMVALQACPQDSAALSPRDVGWVRRALANTISRDGAPGSERRAELRAAQAAIAARPTRQALAQVLAGRLDRYPADGGLPELDTVSAAVTPDELAPLHRPEPLPATLVTKAARALEAPVSELVERGVIGSGEVLARVLPQVTAQHVSAGMDDPVAAGLHARTYASFRRRRSLLLLDLEHQVRLAELPWVAALQAFRRQEDATADASREALRQVVLLALTAFPQALLPNPLVRELGALSTQAGLRLPLVEEVAADIFMGTFTTKWRSAARVAAAVLDGSVYARYYDLPTAQTWDSSSEQAARGLWERWRRRRGKQTAEDFTALCRQRAVEAGARGHGRGGGVAANGAVLEQSQILTTHNLAVLVDALSLAPQVAQLAPALFEQVLRELVRTWERLPAAPTPRLRALKQLAYGWRQAVLLLSFCSPAQQRRLVAEAAAATATGRPAGLAPVVAGLQHVLDGERFDGTGRTADGRGRRLLGWSVGPHWLDAAEGTRSVH